LPTPESSWGDLARELKELKSPEKPIRAEWFANEGCEDYGIWLLLPDGPLTAAIRAEFSLIAACAIGKLGLQPIPIPEPLQYDPQWRLYCQAEEKANEAPPLPENPVSRAGDLWICGKHRVLCGDCTSAEVVARLLGERKPVLMVTDPPYGIELDSEWRDRVGLNGCGPAEASYMKKAHHRATPKPRSRETRGRIGVPPSNSSPTLQIAGPSGKVFSPHARSIRQLVRVASPSS
jgi:hypothetical protein